MSAMMTAQNLARRRLPAFRHLATMLGVIIVGGALLIAIFAPYLTPHDPFAQDLNLRLIPPVWMDGGQPAHLLGTDQIGRDYLSRLIYGARISMLIGVLAVIASGAIGITLGIVGGFYGGRADDIVMFVLTCRLSIPLILVALTVVRACIFWCARCFPILPITSRSWQRWKWHTRSSLKLPCPFSAWACRRPCRAGD